MTSLHARVYVSSAIVPFSDGDLEALLHDARTFNQEVGVTGTLIYTGGSFFQYFEGPPAGVAEVYERVKRSRRHTLASDLLFQPISRRMFPDWLMALSHSPASEVLRLQNASWRFVAAKLADDGAETSPGLALLRDYWHHNGSVL